MAGFADVMLARVPARMEVPRPLRLLFEWVDRNGFVQIGADGDTYGALSADWPNGPGTNVLLRGSPPDEVGERIAAWFGPTRDGLPPPARDRVRRDLLAGGLVRTAGARTRASRPQRAVPALG